MLDPLQQWGVLAMVAVAAAVIAIAFAVIMLRRRPARFELLPPDLSIDVASLEPAGPPATGPRLEFYHVPVRLAVMVLSPTGRGGVLPPPDKLPAIVDQLVPGFLEVVNYHRPMYRAWPAQLSSQGFAHAFFANVHLPGERGKGTPWCGAAGRFEADGEKFQIGLVLCAASPNSLSHVVVERDTQWLDLLRVRR
jgi:hypothetical protein